MRQLRQALPKLSLLKILTTPDPPELKAASQVKSKAASYPSRPSGEPHSPPPPCGFVASRGSSPALHIPTVHARSSSSSDSIPGSPSLVSSIGAPPSRANRWRPRFSSHTNMPRRKAPLPLPTGGGRGWVYGLRTAEAAGHAASPQEASERGGRAGGRGDAASEGSVSACLRVLRGLGALGLSQSRSCAASERHVSAHLGWE
jgi:hypothetical protein